ncbi:MAG: hypothetical protein KAV00_10510 [Phycisphaerae bacterium]|nr:hypothetical protein [Phycisphaerae bacterium]
MQFLYFFPDEMVVTPASLAEAGLLSIISTPRSGEITGSFQSGQVTKGPGGRRGVLVTSTEGPEVDLRYEADKQTWYPPQGPDDDYGHPCGYWIGFWTDDPPTPDNLARPEQIEGVEVTMADKRQWLVPIARRFGGGLEKYKCELPNHYKRDDETGRIVFPVLARYAELWDLSGRLAESFIEPFLGTDPPTEAVGKKFTIGEGWETVAVALDVNYRVGFWEIFSLGLLDDLCLRDVCFAVIDFASLRSLGESLLSKKNETEDSLDGTSGDADSTATTDPAGPTNTPSD